MGLIYSSSDASNVINTLNTNLGIANSIVDQLNAGSQRLVAAIDGHTLSGAAYTAGKGLFSELVLPTIQRVSTAITNVQNDLTKFSAANSYISDEGYLDEDNLREQLTILKSSKASLENAAHMVGTLANVPIPAIAELLRDQQREFLRRAESYQKDINRVKKKIQKLTEFDVKTKGLFQSSLDDFELAMQAVLVLNETTVNSDGSYSLPKGVDKTWFSTIKPNAKQYIGMSSNAFLALYQQVKELMDPLTSGKTDNMKRLEQLLALYPKALVDKLMKNDEFWMLADKLPSKTQTKLINSLAKYESFGQAVAQGKWIPKIDTIGKGYQWFNKMTNPIKTYVSESLKNSQFIQGAKNWGVAKGLGTAGQVATYAQLGVTFVSSGVNEYGKTGSIGKGVIGGAIDTVKSIGPLEGMTIGGTIGGAMGTAIPIPILGTISGVVAGTIVGGVVGGINKLGQFINPDLYDDIKDGAYKLYDKTAEVVGAVSRNIGKAVEQRVDTVKQAYRDVQQVGKSVGKTLSSVKVSKIIFSW
ncbi:T7SS effector LXG polymorphic toxin [Enterococcus hirae]|uniref:T7SS effector LXG polymorphic toxin n=1 Tax=Enterococcus hirae TaxID=1354 RepID=UPI0039A5FFFC